MFTTRELAQLAGVSGRTLNEIENGRGVPIFRTMRKISEALDLEPTDVTEFVAAIEERSKDAA